MTRKSNQKKLTNWQRLSKKLPESVRAAIRCEEVSGFRDPDQVEHQRLRNALPGSVQADLDDSVLDMEDAEDAAEPKWCLCEMPEGDFPRVRIFNTAEGLARRISQLQGSEIAAWPFYGIPMRLTASYEENDRRYMLLPGEQAALSIPQKGSREPVERIEAELLSHLEWQTDGWLGDPAMAEGASEEYYLHNASLADSDEEFDDEEFEDDDDDDPAEEVDADR